MSSIHPTTPRPQASVLHGLFFGILLSIPLWAVIILVIASIVAWFR
ncbi:MAG: hypothetical protein ACO1RT_08010 [Planctomycetaceae bacterium]